LYIAWLIGLLIALKRWRRHPRTSMYMCVGLGIFFGATLVMNLAYIILPRLLFNLDIPLLFLGLGLFSSTLDVAAWVFVLLAVFGERTKPFSIPREELPDLGGERYTGTAIQEDPPNR
jgi:hypothetical protein